jgi:hypothetical protein
MQKIAHYLYMRLFNLDLHVSVIADVKQVLSELYGARIDIVNWNISPQRWISENTTRDVKIINSRTWKKLDRQMVAKFAEEHGAFLAQFDGFIVTHTPVFAILFEKFYKPIIMVNSCRYEQPFSFRESRCVGKWEALGASLAAMADRGQLVAVSNNRGDRDYLRIGTGVNSALIPSLCLYPNIEYQAATAANAHVVYSPCPYARTGGNVMNLTEFVGIGYKLEDLYKCRSITHFPYECSTMSIFEQYSACIPLFFPTKEYLKKLIGRQDYHFCSRYTTIGNRARRSIVQMNRLDAPFPEVLAPALGDEVWVDFWLDRADYYDESAMPHLIYFSSADELDEKRKTTDFGAVSAAMRSHNTTRKATAHAKWRALLDGIVLGSEDSIGDSC